MVSEELSSVFPQAGTVNWIDHGGLIGTPVFANDRLAVGDA